MSASGADILVIGYGNDMRRDDGAGRWVAERIERLDLPDVEVHSVAQLNPEMALAVSGRSLVVFVDASIDTSELTVEQVIPSPGSRVMTHHGDPGTLLSMVPSIGSLPHASYLVSIPAHDFDIGFGMSPRTEASANAAVDAIIGCIARSSGGADE